MDEKNNFLFLTFKLKALEINHFTGETVWDFSKKWYNPL